MHTWYNQDSTQHVRLSADCLLAKRTSEQAPRKWRPWNASNTEHLSNNEADSKARFVSPHLQRREHLPFLLAINQTVVVLHGNKRRQVVCDSIVCVVLSACSPLDLQRRNTLHRLDWDN